MRILVIEPDRSLSTAIGRALRGAGYDVDLGSDPTKARALLDATDYDFLFTEILMPGVDGLDIIKMARQRHPGIHIIAASAGSSRIPASTCLKLAEAFGAARALFKPFRMAELLAAIKDTSAAA